MNENHKNLEMIDDLIVIETKAMVKFALSKGLKVNPAAITTLQNIERTKTPSPQLVKSIVNHHNSLATLIQPALPKNVVYLAEREYEYAHRTNRFESKFPMLRKLLAFGVGSTLVLILLSLTKDVSSIELQKGVFNSNGIGLLINILFLCSAAGIGASFLVLSNVKSKFSDGLYHPDQDSSFWITILLGIIGGIIMSEMIKIDPPTDPTFGTNPAYVNNKLLLALLGGFSSKLVYNVMNKLIVAIESLISGGQEAKAEFDLIKTKSESEIQISKMQLNLTGQLSALQSRISQKGADPEINEDISNTMNSIFEDLGIVDVPETVAENNNYSTSESEATSVNPIIGQ